MYSRIISAFLLSFSLALPARAQAPANKSEKTAKLEKAAKELFDATNRFRADEKRTELKWNPRLAEAAESFVKFMASTDRYGHEADGKSPAERAKERKYDYCALAENIAYVYSSEGYDTGEVARGLFAAWKDSPAHRGNMLDGDVVEAGMAVARSEKSGKYYGVQMFGRPGSMAIAFEVVNEAGEDVQYQVGDDTLALGPRVTRTHHDCRKIEIRFAGPGFDTKGEPESFRPVTGDRFVISKKDGKLHVSKEKIEATAPAEAKGK